MKTVTWWPSLRSECGVFYSGFATRRADPTMGAGDRGGIARKTVAHRCVGRPNILAVSLYVGVGGVKQYERVWLIGTKRVRTKFLLRRRFHDLTSRFRARNGPKHRAPSIVA